MHRMTAGSDKHLIGQHADGEAQQHWFRHFPTQNAGRTCSTKPLGQHAGTLRCTYSAQLEHPVDWVLKEPMWPNQICVQTGWSQCNCYANLGGRKAEQGANIEDVQGNPRNSQHPAVLKPVTHGQGGLQATWHCESWRS